MAKWAPFGLVITSLVLAGVVCALVVTFMPRDVMKTSNMNQVRMCIPRAFASDSIVCVCNSTYCDTMEALSAPEPDHIFSFTTSREGARFEKSELVFQLSPIAADVSFKLTFKKRQKMKGFGGAFTDAAGINILNLTSKTREYLLSSYFAPEGIEYNIGRIPMASCDFSTRLYTYADQANDFKMENFSLASEDFQFKIPLIKRAKEISSKTMYLFGSPWSAPAWMKTNNALFGKGSLLGKAGDLYHQAWALYFARFIEEYERNGVKMWGLTAQNEPRDGLAPDFDFQCMGFTAEEQRDFVKLDLGPTLHARGHNDVMLMVGDDQRQVLPDWADVVLSDKDAAQYVSGIAVHWYMDFVTHPSRLSETHDSHPNQFILGTEACAGAMPWVKKEDHVVLGSWIRGQRYSQDVLSDLNNWAVGWVDWNLALNMEGGPNWVKNFVDSPIIVNAENDEFYKQPMFYHLGHFSKFIPEDSHFVEILGPEQDGDLKYAGFLHPDESIVSLIILNTSKVSVNAEISDPTKGNVAIQIPPMSIQTYVWSSFA